MPLHPRYKSTLDMAEKKPAHTHKNPINIRAEKKKSCHLLTFIYVSRYLEQRAITKTPTQSTEAIHAPLMIIPHAPSDRRPRLLDHQHTLHTIPFQLLKERKRIIINKTTQHKLNHTTHLSRRRIQNGRLDAKERHRCRARLRLDRSRERRHNNRPRLSLPVSRECIGVALSIYKRPPGEWEGGM